MNSGDLKKTDDAHQKQMLFEMCLTNPQQNMQQKRCERMMLMRKYDLIVETIKHVWGGNKISTCKKHITMTRSRATLHDLVTAFRPGPPQRSRWLPLRAKGQRHQGCHCSIFERGFWGFLKFWTSTFYIILSVSIRSFCFFKRICVHSSLISELFHQGVKLCGRHA